MITNSNSTATETDDVDASSEFAVWIMPKIVYLIG